MTTPDWTHLGITVGIGALVVLLGGKVVTWVFALADRVSGHRPASPPAPAVETSIVSEETPVIATTRQLRGGAWIGMLERLAIFASLLAHYPDGLAIALAVKGLARYPELKAPDTGVAERFIIGTFVSVLLAAGAAGLVIWLVG